MTKVSNEWKERIYTLVTEELVKFCREGDNKFINKDKYSSKRRDNFVFALTQLISKIFQQQREEIIEECLKGAKDDMTGLYDYDRIAENVIDLVKND